MDSSNWQFEVPSRRHLAVGNFCSRHFINAEGRKLRKDQEPSEVYPFLIPVQHRQRKGRQPNKANSRSFEGRVLVEEETGSRPEAEV